MVSMKTGEWQMDSGLLSVRWIANGACTEEARVYFCDMLAVSMKRSSDAVFTSEL